MTVGVGIGRERLQRQGLCDDIVHLVGEGGELFRTLAITELLRWIPPGKYEGYRPLGADREPRPEFFHLMDFVQRNPTLLDDENLVEVLRALRQHEPCHPILFVEQSGVTYFDGDADPYVPLGLHLHAHCRVGKIPIGKLAIRLLPFAMLSNKRQFESGGNGYAVERVLSPGDTTAPSTVLQALAELKRLPKEWEGYSSAGVPNSIRCFGTVFRNPAGARFGKCYSFSDRGWIPSVFSYYSALSSNAAIALLDV